MLELTLKHDLQCLTVHLEFPKHSSLLVSMNEQPPAPSTFVFLLLELNSVLKCIIGVFLCERFLWYKTP